MSRYTHKRSVFVSSNQRVRGASDDWLHDFYLDLDSVITRDIHPIFTQRDPDIKIFASVAQLYVPLPKNSKGVLEREPAYTEGSSVNNTRHVPRVNLVRLHTNLQHNNADETGFSSIVLQAPFLPHYYEADPNNAYANAAWVYEPEHPESHTTFELVNGTRSLGLVRFTLTDENNRRFLTAPTADVHMILTLKTESTARKRKHQEHTSQLLRELLAVQRLGLLQNDILSNRQLRRVLDVMQSQTGGAEDLLNDEEVEERQANQRARRPRKFLSDEQERTERAYYNNSKDDPGPSTMDGAAYVDEEERPFSTTYENEEERQEDP